MDIEKNSHINTMHAFARTRQDDQLKVLDNLIDREDESTSEELPELPTGRK